MNKPLILNVDDYGPGRYSRSRALRNSGFEVLEASSGEEALRLLDRKPELVLLDVNLPDLNGLDVCRHIKQNDETAGIIVLHLSASRQEPEDQRRGLDNGADGYLTEPVDPEVLTATIRALLRARHAEAALRDANGNLISLTNMLSHELHESLRNVASFSQLLERRLTGRLDSTEQQYMKFVRDGAEQLRGIIEGALEYFTYQEQVADTPAGDALGDALSELKVLIAENNAVIQAEDLPVVEAGRLTMVRLFTNLISNAIKYRSKEAPSIAIRARPAGIFWQFSITDNGMGIDPKDHARIFEMFKRLHGKEYHGSGVGLALCKRLVEKKGGKIWVESLPGAGATFYFTLPAVRSDGTVPGIDAANATGA